MKFKLYSVIFILFICSCLRINKFNDIGVLIDASLFDAKMSSGEYTLIDIRSKKEYDTEKISEKALLINFYDENFKKNINALEKNKKYLLHCRSGGRSAKANRIMKQLGFIHYYELRGGIIAWQKYLSSK